MFQISTHGLFFLIGALLCRSLCRMRLSTQEQRHLDRSILYMVLGAGLGARLLFLLTRPQLFNSSWWKFWEGGMVSYGGLGGALLALIWYRRQKQLPLLSFFDRSSPCFLVGWAVGRFGCLFHWWGEEGLASSVPWSLRIAGRGYHPHQLYLIAILLSAAFWLWHRPQVRRGQNSIAALGAFALARFSGDLWRHYDPAYLKPLSLTFCALLFGFSLLGFRKGQDSAPVSLKDSSGKTDGG